MQSQARIARVLIPLVVFCAVLLLSSTAWACPGCKQALSEDGSQGDLARGIYYSILFMMSMPFTLVGTFGALMYRAVKREQRRKAEEESRAADE